MLLHENFNCLVSLVDGEMKVVKMFIRKNKILMFYLRDYSRGFAIMLRKKFVFISYTDTCIENVLWDFV